MILFFYFFILLLSLTQLYGGGAINGGLSITILLCCAKLACFHKYIGNPYIKKQKKSFPKNPKNLSFSFDKSWEADFWSKCI